MNVDKYELEERAAIMEYEGGLPRHIAEKEAARAYGFQSWKEAIRAASKTEEIIEK